MRIRRYARRLALRPPGRRYLATLIELLAEATTAAACALGIMGRVEARDLLKRCLIEKPSPRVIEALAGVADEEAIVFLARFGRKRPELANSVLSALEAVRLRPFPAIAVKPIATGRRPNDGEPR